MKWLSRLTASKEVRAALGILDEANLWCDDTTFALVRQQIEPVFFGAPEQLAEMLGDGTPVRQLVLNAVASTAANLVESGTFHVYRGLLNAQGQHLLALYDRAVDELVRMRAVDAGYAKEQKAAIRDNIKSAG